MPLGAEACGVAESSGGEAASGCLQFGVRSYLHHFYEECSSSMWAADPQERGPDRRQRALLGWKSAACKVSLALGLLILTAGVASLSAGYSTSPRIESFGEGDLFFVDSQAISFNRGLHVTTAAGIGLSCLGSILAALGVFVWIIPRAGLKERPVRRPLVSRASKWRGCGCPGDVVTRPPSIEEGGVPPLVLSKVESVQPVP